MRNSKFTEEQIVYALKQAELGARYVAAESGPVVLVRLQRHPFGHDRRMVSLMEFGQQSMVMYAVVPPPDHRTQRA